MGRKGIGKIKKAKAFKLTQEEIIELIKQAQNGSEEAEEKLIFANERLVWKMAAKYIHKDTPQEDIYQIGVIGLIKCIRKFDTSYDVKFSTYAVPMILGEIRRFFRDDVIVKISRSVRDLAYKILKKELEEEKPEVIAEELGLVVEDVTLEKAVKKVKESLDFIYNYSVKSTEDNIFSGGNGDEDIKLGEMISSDVNGNWLSHLEVEDAMKSLTEKEQAVIDLRYNHDMGQVEIAKRLGVSQVQVSRLERKALATLKDALTKEEDPMAKNAAGDRKRAAKLLRDTDMSLKDINEVTWVPMDKLEGLEKKFRATEKEVKTVAPAQPVAKPKPVVKEEPIKEEKVIEVTEKKKAPKRITKEQRTQVIELLKKGVYTVPEIEEKTGVAYANIWYYANKLRIDIVKTTAGMEIVAGMDRAKKERQAVNSMIQGGNVGITSKAPTQPSPEMIKRIANAEQKITDADIVSTAPLTVGANVKPLSVGMGIRPVSKEAVQSMQDRLNNRDFSKEIKMLEAASKPAESSFSMTVDLTATGNALPKGEVIGKLEQLIRVVQELPAEKVNFNMKVNN